MQRGLPTIYISVSSMKNITPQLLPYITPSMQYKLIKKFKKNNISK